MSNAQKLNEFEPATYEDWLKLVERDLAGAPFEKKLVKRVSGIDIRPLYTRADEKPDSAGFPGFSPFTRGSFALGPVEMGWDVRAEVSLADPKTASLAILDELNGGATSIALKLGRAGASGIAVATLADLEVALEHVALDKVPVCLSAGSSALPAAAALIALARKRGVKPAVLHGCLGADPLGTLASAGALPSSLERAYAQLSELARFTHEHAPALRAVSVSTSAYHDAGADAATEIALALATGVAYLRVLTAAGLDVSAAAQQLVFGFSVGRDFFVEIAKLRAARRTWAKVIALSGGSQSAQAMILHARTSARTKTQRDPWVNLLRATAESFCAAVGGAEAITTSPFDDAIGESDEFARRLARNTQHLLRHESNVHRVVDAAGGSWYVETLTDELARSAWQKLQALEKSGGIAEALASGSVQKQLSTALEADRKAVETRKLAIIGVNEFPNVREEKVVRARGQGSAGAHAGESAAAALATGASFEACVAAVTQGATLLAVESALGKGERAHTATALTVERYAAPFEALRDAADRTLEKTGKRPSVFLAKLGSIAEHKARASFATNFFEAGGLLVVTNDGFTSAEEAAVAFRKSGAQLACLCSSDAVYEGLAESTARALAELEPKAVVLAGSPGEKEAAYKAAGVTDFIFVGTNAYASLRSMLERAGAWS